MVRDGLRREAGVVDLVVDVRINVLDAEVPHREGSKRRAQMLPDDALIVLSAPFPRSPPRDPVVAEVVKRLLRRRCCPDPALDLVRLQVAPRQFALGGPVVVEDGAPPPAALIEPANSPFVPVPGGLCHDLLLAPSRSGCLLQPRRDPLQERLVRGRVAQEWPKTKRIRGTDFSIPQ